MAKAVASKHVGVAQSVAVQGNREDARIVDPDGRAVPVFLLRNSREPQFIWPGQPYNVYSLNGKPFHIKDGNGSRVRLGPYDENDFFGSFEEKLTLTILIVGWFFILVPITMLGMGQTMYFILGILYFAGLFMIHRYRYIKKNPGSRWVKQADALEKALP